MKKLFVTISIIVVAVIAIILIAQNNPEIPTGIIYFVINFEMYHLLPIFVHSKRVLPVAVPV